MQRCKDLSEDDKQNRLDLRDRVHALMKWKRDKNANNLTWHNRTPITRNMIIRVWPLKRREMFRWNPVTPAIQAWIDKQASTDNFKSYEANAMGEVSGTWPSYIKLLIQNFSDT